MPESENSQSAEIVALAVEIVSAYVGNNSVHMADLPNVIASIHSALRSLGQPRQPVQEKRTPLMPIKKTITPDHLISLEDGKRYKSLRRHLGGRGLTPEQYREKWGLPKDYPMVAPNYSAKRSQMAKSFGLGQMRQKQVAAAPAIRGRRKAA
ncbi:MucR family transcriptional regulator [Micromonospora sp. STR1s_5]|nr:MucR family transcriptional regulator [Micromonospora sp. STR1s_5]